MTQTQASGPKTQPRPHDASLLEGTLAEIARAAATPATAPPQTPHLLQISGPASR